MISIGKITVVDSIMGSGKTSAMLNLINSDTKNSYIYVTPYLSEISRVCQATDNKFRQPHNLGSGKLDYLHQQLAAGEDIVTTHSLFLKATAETVQLIQEGGYRLILDEALDVFRDYNEMVKELDGKAVKKDDVIWLKQDGAITISPDTMSVSWTGPAPGDCHFSEVARLAENNTLKCVDDMLYWEFPPVIFSAFEQVYILTYMFEGSTFSSYMDMHHFEYDKVSVEATSAGGYELCTYSDDVAERNKYAELISIYDGSLNDLGAKQNAFSISYLLKGQPPQLDKIKNAMRCYKDRVHASMESLMWTTTKRNDFYKKFEFKGFKYTKRLSAEERNNEDILKKYRCFVPCNARATNDYSGRSTLLYLLNRFPNPEIAKYFSGMGSPIDQGSFATSELLQWIWRSAIRNGQHIDLYIPSSRMRGLLTDWLGVT